jgi:heptosyltransferase-2
MAPGAAYGRAKQWLPERFGELARLLAAERGVATVVVGAGGDRGTGDEIRAAVGDLDGYVDLIGHTDLAELAALLASARAVVANDSGAMHLAGAVGAAVVAVFGATNEHHTAPLTPGAGAPVPTILTHPVWCRPCMLRECPIDHGCMRGVSARRVLEALP